MVKILVGIMDRFRIGDVDFTLLWIVNWFWGGHYGLFSVAPFATL